jgi:sterol desaturase/sphingolipid hydroxylase (fatty acid hydroxylase superfamily)
MALLELTQECIDAANGKWPGVEPGSKRKDRPISIPVFTNWIVEHVFARAHWVTPILWFGPIIAYGIYRGLRDPRTAGWHTGALFVSGWLIWTLIEYLLHRYFFHLKPTNDKERIRAFLSHGYHHDFPDDPMRLVAPPVMSWGPAIIVGTVYYFVFGTHYWLPIMAGTASGYVAYDWIHYYTHHGRPHGGIGKWLRRYHMKHHYQDGDAWYGVSTPIWDYVFGTHRSKKVPGQPAEAH